jgi:hypothetical protein
MNILILGIGEIGKSVAGLYDSNYNLFFNDKNYTENICTIKNKDDEDLIIKKYEDENIDVTHVCYGYDEKDIIVWLSPLP